jgi:hypothetical protein
VKVFKEKNAMKAKSRKLISIKSIPILALALLIVSGLALAAVHEPVSISGEVDLITFSGTATVTIGGEELEVTVQVIPKQPPVPKDGGLYFPEVEHVFNLADGSTLITTGEELAMPTDENPAIYTLHGNMEIIDGTGVFDGASGELRVNGQMDWSIGQATFDAKGAISR